MIILHYFRQMGSLYFMTPRKVQLRRVREIWANTQYDYLVYEGETIGMKVYVCLLVFEFYKGHSERVPRSKVSLEGFVQQ